MEELIKRDVITIGQNCPHGEKSHPCSWPYNDAITPSNQIADDWLSLVKN